MLHGRGEVGRKEAGYKGTGSEGQEERRWEVRGGERGNKREEQEEESPGVRRETGRGRHGGSRGQGMGACQNGDLGQMCILSKPGVFNLGAPYGDDYKFLEVF